MNRHSEGVRIFTDNIRVNSVPEHPISIHAQPHYEWYIVFLVCAGIYHLVLNYGIILIALACAFIGGISLTCCTIAVTIRNLYDDTTYSTILSLAFNMINTYFRTNSFQQTPRQNETSPVSGENVNNTSPVSEENEDEEENITVDDETDSEDEEENITVENETNSENEEENITVENETDSENEDGNIIIS